MLTSLRFCPKHVHKSWRSWRMERMLFYDLMYSCYRNWLFKDFSFSFIYHHLFSWYKKYFIIIFIAFSSTVPKVQVSFSDDLLSFVYLSVCLLKNYNATNCEFLYMHHEIVWILIIKTVTNKLILGSKKS